MKNLIKDLFKTTENNSKINKKEINNAISNFKKNSASGEFHIPVGKIDHFYKNISNQIKKGNGVLIYADYDVDGMLSCTMMIETLAAIAKQEVKKGNADEKSAKAFLEKLKFKIPKRTDGYGISQNFVKAVLQTGSINYIITCDNGTHKSVLPIIADEHYKDKYFAFDHHANGDFGKFPNIFNPNVDGKVEISTGILLYKFFDKLSQRHDLELPDLADLAAFTAVSDVASLDSNRDIVQKGLNIINNAEASYNLITKKIDTLGEEIVNQITNKNFEKAEKGIEKIGKMENLQAEIEKLAKLRRPIFSYFFKNKSVISTKDLAFGAIPMMNAINRIGADSEPFIRMVMQKQESVDTDTKTKDFLDNGYAALNHLNERRKKVAYEATKQALHSIEVKQIKNNPFILVFTENLSVGINGLVAQRVFDNTGADVIAASRVNSGKDTGKIVFSGRGENVHNNLTRLMNYYAELNKDTDKEPCFSFGGHLKALGGSIKNLKEFTELLKMAIENNILISNDATSELDLAKQSHIVLSKPITLFEYVELSKYLTQKTDAIPYSKNFLAPVIVTHDMISNADTAAAKTKTQDFVMLKLGFKNPLSDIIEKVDFIATSDSAEILINKSKEIAENRKMPIFLMELSNNCSADGDIEAFSGKIVFAEQLDPIDFIKPHKTPKEKISSGIKTGM